MIQSRILILRHAVNKEAKAPYLNSYINEMPKIVSAT
jgi:hypothetical protein